jgi:hypothetical protein
MKPSRAALALLLCTLSTVCVFADDGRPSQLWDYAHAMKRVAVIFHGRTGVVLHVGDSISYANPYGQWARQGEGRTTDDKALLTWMHAGADDDSDGWWLARFDHPDGGRSHTASSGMRTDELLAGGKNGLPALCQLLETYRPQLVVLMIGTNDVNAGRAVAAYRADLERAVDLLLGQGIVCIISTLPPHPAQQALAKSYNDAIRAVARAREMPLIDYEQEILQRRPKDWNGTLLQRNDVHPTAEQGGTSAASEPTPENLRNSGYLLRGWLSVQKIGEVKRTVLDPLATVVIEPVKSPQGQAVRVAVTRDTWFSNYGEEADANLGGAGRLKLKSNQEMSLIDIDAAPLKGRVITGATLHVRLSGDQPLRRVTVGSFAAEWVEGTSDGYKPQPGSSSFNHRRHPDVPWTVAGSDLTAVMLGQGGTIWRMADAFPPDAQGWQRVAIDPSVVAARVAGVSHGLLLFDDTGSEWTRQGDKFTLHLFPNRFVHSREAGADNAPYLTVYLGPEDTAPPAAPTDLRAETAGLPAGEAWLSWVTPADSGPAGTTGFVVTASDKEVPRYLVPAAGKPGQRVRMRLRDLGLAGGARVQVAVKAVDGAGNVGPAAEVAVVVADRTPRPLPGTAPIPFTEEAALPRLGDIEVAVLDELDKVQPVSGEMIPPQPAAYLAANHLWNAKTKQLRLAAARNEFVAFQVLVRGPIHGLLPELTFEEKTLQTAFGRYRHIASQKGPLPDPVMPLNGPLDLPAADETFAGQKSGSLLGEIYVPHDISPGDHKGTLTLRAGVQALELAVTLRVWDFTLPDFLSFLPEMNCYSLPANEGDYYRLAHRHRTVLNRVPYHQNGSVDDGCAPGWDGTKFDWAAWDRRFGPLLDGVAFADLPRKGVPLECFYLPLHENWPSPMDGNYNGDYWADRAFPPRYRGDFVETSRQFAAHCNARGWNDTLFEFFLNGKNNFKVNGWNRGSSPWLLDEPSNFQDYWALRYFGAAFHEGVNQAGGKAKLVFRADISRPQWQRDTLDGLLDYNVAGRALRGYQRSVMDRKEANGEIVIEYAGSNPIEEANTQPVGWSLDAWSLGCDGVLPWQTLGSAASWKKADELALFYPVDGHEPVPSIRLKAFRRGQQDVEYLTLWSQTLSEPRWAVGQKVREALHLAAVRKGEGEEAGSLHYDKLLPQDLWALRARLGEALSAAHPEAKRRLVEFRPPPREPAKLPPAYVSVGEVPGPGKPDASTATPAPIGKELQGPAGKGLQGPAVVHDTLIDFGQPERNFGKEGRNNALRRAEQCNAFLVRFDFDKLGLPADAKVAKATVSFFVWDPSDKGNTKVCAFALKTPWDEQSATWRQAATGKLWQGGQTFAFGKDTGLPGPPVVVKPDQGSDTVDPPLEYQIDVTDLVRDWLSGAIPNHGLAIAPVIDRATDEGQFTRFQVYASEHERVRYTPKLTVQLER